MAFVGNIKLFSAGSAKITTQVNILNKNLYEMQLSHTAVKV